MVSSSKQDKQFQRMLAKDARIITEAQARQGQKVDTMETLEQEATGTKTATERKQLTAEQKQAATLRRDAALLNKHGLTAKANELLAQAQALAPVGERTQRVDPLTELSKEEQHKLRAHFSITVDGFKLLAQVVSYKTFQKVLESIG